MTTAERYAGMKDHITVRHGNVHVDWYGVTQMHWRSYNVHIANMPVTLQDYLTFTLDLPDSDLIDRIVQMHHDDHR